MRIVFFTFLLAFSLVTNGYSHSAQTLRMNIRYEPMTLDPALQEDFISGNITRALFEGLVRLEQGRPVKAVASDIVISDDKLTYTFTLRDSKWSNGEPVTAHDFAYAWFRTLDPKTGSPIAHQLYYIKNAKPYLEGTVARNEVGIDALNEKTLQVTLEHPTPYFLELLARHYYLPLNRHFVESNPHWADQPKLVVGNGPFQLVKWKYRDEIVLKKNPHYWDQEAVQLEQILLTLVDEPHTELDLYLTGDLDWAGSPLGSLPIDAIPHLADEGRLITLPKARTQYIRFNTEKYPFTNQKIRQAFAYALNRQEITEHVTQAGQVPLTGFVPVSMQLKPGGYFKDFDLETAKSLLAEGLNELGLTSLPKIVFLFYTSELNHKVAQVLQDQLRSGLGVDVRIKNVEGKVFFDSVEQGNYDFCISGWTADYDDPMNFLEKFMVKESTNNNTNWHNPIYTALLEQARIEPNEEKRDQLMLRAETILMTEMPITPLYSDVSYWIQSDRITGIEVDTLGYIDFKYGACHSPNIVD
ncbi:peptide ABC transporter substrate-binding protein [Ammoniphilus sp. YIM 78166]|uniref:peptide ABC transporter substrate-binding protein n=1 Tax=Ammoniphilus sp. YIM 78166 TaxID=1644106 RepID=UPI00106FF14A|nr:peptide ABC transporter substrate-binding protein [Ammoniphilus sp. YIM 78166]